MNMSQGPFHRFDCSRKNTRVWTSEAEFEWNAVYRWESQLCLDRQACPHGFTSRNGVKFYQLQSFNLKNPWSSTDPSKVDSLCPLNRSWTSFHVCVFNKLFQQHTDAQLCKSAFVTEAELPLSWILLQAKFYCQFLFMPRPGDTHALCSQNKKILQSRKENRKPLR